MNEEEKKAIEYSKNCLMKITLGIDCEFDVNILDTLLNIIKKLKKESEELKNQEATARKINELLVQRYSNSISVQKVKDKIEELDIEISTCEYADDDSEEYKQEVEKDKAELLMAKKVLQQLLESEEEKRK